jgi:hypothetical protein
MGDDQRQAVAPSPQRDQSVEQCHAVWAAGDSDDEAGPWETDPNERFPNLADEGRGHFAS